MNAPIEIHATKLVNLATLSQNLESLAWVEHSSHGRQGARIHYLYRNEQSGQQVALVHCRPGTQAMPHRHLGHESIFVLEGSFQDDAGRYGKGELVVFPEGSHHGWTSPEGGLMYVVWGGPVTAYNG